MNFRLAAVALLLPALISALPSAPSPAAASAAPAQAGHRHYDESARRVAREIDCKRIYSHGALMGYHDAATCYLRGERVGVITFKSAAQQRRFNRRVDYGARYWWASGKGALVMPDDARERSVARVGARRLPGVVMHG